MSDPVGEIRVLLQRYQDAMSSGDTVTLSDLHWQDARYTHLGPAGADVGWSARERSLADAFAHRPPAAYALTDLRIEVFHGKFACAGGRWDRGGPAGPAASGGRVLFVLSRMGSSWKIVADHHAAAPVGRP
jgi:ketosteroid isomerase-like protein